MRPYIPAAALARDLFLNRWGHGAPVLTYADVRPIRADEDGTMRELLYTEETQAKRPIPYDEVSAEMHEGIAVYFKLPNGKPVEILSEPIAFPSFHGWGYPGYFKPSIHETLLCIPDTQPIRDMIAARAPGEFFGLDVRVDLETAENRYGLMRIEVSPHKMFDDLAGLERNGNERDGVHLGKATICRIRLGL